MLNLSNCYFPTLKEIPAEAEIASHKLLYRAGMIRRVGSGIYTFLPLGFKVLSKVKKIIREEIAKTGTQELLMPMLQPAELWHESGRWHNYGPELMRLNDRHEREFCLGPTHEELIVDLVRDELRSYKQLPVALCQMSDKFRDEVRPRFGLLRSREFVMHDTYSFHASQKCLDEFYEKMGVAYGRICNRLGMKWRRVEADSGQIGGSVTAEFMALAESGESDLVYCECGFAADVEAAKVKISIPETQERNLEEISTPHIHTISELSDFLKIEQNATVKALAGCDAKGIIYVLFLPGNHDLNDIKACALFDGFRLLNDEELAKHNLVKGSMGPVDLPANVKLVADESLRTCVAWTCGANKDGYHLIGACPGRDFKIDVWADLVTAKLGDICPKCGKVLSGNRGIEVSQIFELGTKYSEAMHVTYMDKNGKEQPFIMGCYGIGVTRSMAAIIEQYNDDYGIKWPISVAPADLIVLPLQFKDDAVCNAAQNIAQTLEEQGIDVAYDDRKERPGVKFADADLIGWPYQLVIGKRGLDRGVVEFKNRHTGEKTELDLEQAVSIIVSEIRAAYKNFK